MARLATTTLATAALAAAALSALVTPPLRADDEIPLKGAPEPQAVSPLLARDMPDQLDAYARTTADLARLSGRFQDQYQRFIHTLDELNRTNKPMHGTKTCLPDDLAVLYSGARQSWAGYHRQARIVRNQYRRLEAFQSAGYAPGLTPDLQDRLRRAVEGYEQIRQEHVNIQSLFQGQLEGELKRLGCDPEDIVAPPKPVPAVVAVAKVPHASADQKARPHLSRSEKLQRSEEPRAFAGEEEEGDAEGESPQASQAPPQTLQPEEIESAENMLPPENTPSPDSSSASPSPAPAVAPAREPTPEPSGEKEEDAEASADKGQAQVTPKPTPTPVPGPAELNVSFTVDNRLCSLDQDVYLDGRKLGTAPGKGLVTFSASEGRHSLCLSRAGEKDPCKQPTDLIRLYLYDGFAVKPRC